MLEEEPTPSVKQKDIYREALTIIHHSKLKEVLYFKESLYDKKRISSVFIIREKCLF